MERVKEYIADTKNERQVTQNILDAVLKNIHWIQSEDPEILDVGCGPGNVTKEILIPKLPENFKKVIGIDIDHDYIAYAKTNYADDRVVFTKMDIEEGVPPAYDLRFDLVTSFLCLNQLKNKENAITIISKCVKPGGNFILIFEVHKYLDDFLHEMSKKPEWQQYAIPHGTTFYELNEVQNKYITIIKQIGFIPVSCDLIRLETPFNRKQYIEYGRNQLPFIKHMSENKAKEYLKYVEDNYVNKGLTAEQAQNSETFISEDTLIVIHAKRN